MLKELSKTRRPKLHYYIYRFIPAHKVEVHCNFLPVLGSGIVSGLGLSREGERSGRSPVLTKLLNIAEPIASLRTKEGPVCMNLDKS